MLSFGMRTEARCVLCRCEDETVKHLCSSCPVAYILLRSCSIPLKTLWADWLNGEFFREKISATERLVGYLHIQVVIYTVWQERNNRIHNNGSQRRTDQLIHEVKRIVREKLFSCSLFQKHIRRHYQIIQLLY